MIEDIQEFGSNNPKKQKEDSMLSRIVTVFVFLVLLIPSAVFAVPVVGNGGLVVSRFVSDDAVVSNATQVFANAFDTNINLGGVANQCIEIRFSSEVTVINSPVEPFHAQFRALVDGVRANGGSPVFDVRHLGEFSFTGYNWWLCGVAPGAHRIRIQFRPRFAGDVASVRNRTLILEFNERGL